MRLPFSAGQFFDVLAEYNQATWPMPIVWMLAALAGVAMLFVHGGWDRALGWLLAALWAWMAVAYHFSYFTRINPAAWWFGAFFLLGAGVFIRQASRGNLRFGRPVTFSHGVGMLLIAYALIGYPLVAAVAGQTYPRVPTFGLPCPTTIFTLGCLLLARRPVSAWLFAVPVCWSFVGTVAAVKLGVVEDYGLLVAALVVLALTGERARGERQRSAHGGARPASVSRSEA